MAESVGRFGFRWSYGAVLAVTVVLAGFMSAPSGRAAQRPETLWTSAVTIDRQATEFESERVARVVSSQAGDRLVAIWSGAAFASDDLDASGWARTLRSSFSDDAGRSWSQPQDISPRDGYVGRFGVAEEALTASDHGRKIFATWVQQDAGITGARVAVARSTDYGRTWRSPIILAGQVAYAPKIFTSGNGKRAVVTWGTCPKATDVCPGLRLEVSRSLDGGRSWSEPRRIGAATPNSGGTQFWDTAASHDARRVTAIWTRGSHRLLSTTSNNSGRTWTHATVISRGYSVAPDIVMSADGAAATAVWLTQQHIKTAQMRWGNAWRKPTALNTPGAPSGAFDVVVSGDGKRAVVVIEAADAQRRPTGTRIWAATRDRSDWSPVRAVSTGSRSPDHRLGQVVASADARVITAIWSSRTGLRATSSTTYGRSWGTSTALPAHFELGWERSGLGVDSDRSGKRLIAVCRDGAAPETTFASSGRVRG